MMVRVFLFDANESRRSSIKSALVEQGYDVWAFDHLGELSSGMIVGQRQPCKNYLVCFPDDDRQPDAILYNHLTRLDLPLSQLAILVNRTLPFSSKYRGISLIEVEGHGANTVLEWLDSRPRTGKANAQEIADTNRMLTAALRD